jgi:lysophospholipase
MELYPTPDNPLPDGSHCVSLRTDDGVTLRAMHAGPREARGTVVILGGRGDFMERYFETARDLVAMGFHVASLDLRGQGGSDRQHADRMRNHVRRFSEYDTDVRTLMRDLVKPRCPPPYFALGHSTGGNVLLRLLRRDRLFARVVVCSPLLGILYGKWPKPIAAALVFLACTLGLGWLFLPGQRKRPLGRRDFGVYPLTSDQRRWQRDSGILEEAPQLGIGAPTFSWLRAARRSIAELRRLGSRSKLTAPVLILAAGDERIVDTGAIRAFTGRVPGVALCFIPDAQHELLSERDEIRRQVLAAIDAFLSPQQ